jgi:hypothetical protein
MLHIFSKSATCFAENLHLRPEMPLCAEGNKPPGAGDANDFLARPFRTAISSGGDRAAHHTAK